MIKLLLSPLIIFCFGSGAWGQAHNPGKINITNNLETFFSHHVFENAYLQFDKPYYAAGDTIYFKAYVTEGEQHQLSELSGVLHVDFINTENKIEQSIKLQLNRGLAWGDFALPDSLPEGNYRVRAYTQLMLNNGQSEFFDRIIPVGSLKESHLSVNVNNEPLKDVEDKVDLQFFPEGGNLVTGIRSKVGFKAIDVNGLGFNIKGVILDNNNEQVCSFSSSHLGMGYFFLSPGEGKTYHAKVIFADGTQKIIDLPIAKNPESHYQLITNLLRKYHL